MDGKSVTLTGLPRSISNVKLKVQIEKRIGSGTVEGVHRTDDSVVIVFKDHEGIKRFLDAEISEIEFGHNIYPVTVSKPSQPSFQDSPQSAEHLFSSPLTPDRNTTPSPKPSPELRSFQKTSKFSQVLQEKLFSNKHSWSSLEDLPAAGGTQCVLVQNIEPSTTQQKIVMHFESRKRAGGGPVAGIISMIDGLLVVFIDSMDAKSCLGMVDQTFEGKNLVIFEKRIPEYYERKFIIQGVGEKTTKDTLTMFLESCSTEEISPLSCVKQELPGVYLAEYGDDFDTSDTQQLLRKAQAQELEGNKLQAKTLLKTDCLRVAGFPSDVSNDQIRLVFESKKRSGGGPVTRIDRFGKDSALVYFSLYEDAERICRRSKESNGSVIINQHPVTVGLYHHSLARDHENVIQDFKPASTKSRPCKDGKKDPLGPFEFEPKCDERLLEFILGQEKHEKILKTVFERFAAVEVLKPEEGEAMKLKFTPQKVFSNMTQEEFGKKCEKNLENHVAKYSQCTKSFDAAKLDKARSLKLYPQIEETYVGNEDNSDLAVRWKPNEPVVEIIGIKQSVDHMMQHITNCVNSTVVTKKFPESQFGVLLHCGIIMDLREKYQSLQIRCDSNDFSVSYVGRESDVNAAQIDALSAMMIEKKKLSGLDEIVVKFLSESMQKSGGITSKIQGKLKQNGVKAFALLDENEACIKAKTQDDFKKAVEVVRQYITVDIIGLDDIKSKVVKSEEWTAFILSLGDSGLFKIYNKLDDKITLVGALSETKVIRAKIKSFLDENSIKRFFMTTEYGKAKFVVEKSQEFSKESCERKEITCGLSPEANGGVFVEGKTEALRKAHPEMRKLVESIIERRCVLEKPGIKEYYSSEDGKQFLENTERVCSCIILTPSRDNPEWLEYSRKNPVHFQPKKSKSTPVDVLEEKLLSVTLPKSAVKLTVWKTDISRHKCDAIVNASNETLSLLPSGVSGIIRSFDVKNGNQIQEEMEDHRKKNYGSLLPGHAIITTAGNLPACKKIVHAIGPRWTSISGSGIADPALVLKACISKSLDCVEKANMKSIAIPAISCGVFGGKVPVCIPLIVDAVDEYFQERGHSCIKEVHFVENSKQDVLDEFVGCLKKYGPNETEAESGQKKASEKKTPSFTKHSFADVSGTAEASSDVSSLQQGNCTVILIEGDIAQQKADVIVNVTDPKNLTNMMNGPVISKVLGNKAGANVVQEVSLLPGPHNVGDVFETSGGGLLCKRLYHALVTHYNTQSSSNIIQAVVSKSLDMADQAGFKSIVFPAIATGGYRYPPNIVAKLMRQEIVTFNGNVLREVIILLHPQNPSAIQAFNAEFNSGAPVSPPSPTPVTNRISFARHKSVESVSQPVVESRGASKKKKEKMKRKPGKSGFEKIDDSCGQFGSLFASIQQGDITEQDCDVIVNSTNESFILNQGMVSKQILAKGGQIIQDEASENKNAKRDQDYIVTTGGRLRCRKIIHLVTPHNPKDLQKKIIKVLFEVEKLKLTSVSMPAFGTGNLNMDIETVASIMHASIQQFVKSQSGSKHLEEVTIVIFDKLVLKDFKLGFFTPKKGIMDRIMDWGGSVLGLLNLTSQEPDEEEWEHLAATPTSLNMFIYSTKEEDIQQAIKYVTDEMRKMLNRSVIEDTTIGRLTDWEIYDMLKSGEKNKVSITDASDRYLQRLILEGLTKDVMKTQEEIKDILREFAAAETCATYITWQKNVGSGRWENYHMRSGQILEKAFKERTRTKGGNAPSVIKVREFDGEKVTEHDVDLSLLDSNQQGKSPKVRRRVNERSVSDIPDYWDDMKGQQLLMVTLQQGSQEYQNVLAKFKATANGQIFWQNVVSIQRVQNISLYKQYVAKKSEVTGKLKNFTGQIERDLFHGTTDDDKIILHGFDRSYAGKNNILFGRGVYFATDPAFSHTYAQPNAQGQRRMFLANVITGEFCVGNQNMVAPPQRTNSPIKNDLFDSTVNNATNPTIFVIYKDASAYPAYCMTYT